MMLFSIESFVVEPTFSYSPKQWLACGPFCISFHLATINSIHLLKITVNFFAIIAISSTLFSLIILFFVHCFVFVCHIYLHFFWYWLSFRFCWFYLFISDIFFKSSLVHDIKTIIINLLVLYFSLILFLTTIFNIPFIFTLFRWFFISLLFLIKWIWFKLNEFSLFRKTMLIAIWTVH